MKFNFFNRLFFRQAKNVFVIGIILGLLASGFQISLDFFKEIDKVDLQAKLMLSMINESAAQAVYNLDGNHAKRIAAGLSEFKPFIFIRITDDFNSVLAEWSRPIPLKKTKFFLKEKKYTVELIYGKKNERVGKLEIILDTYIIEQIFLHNLGSFILADIIKNIILACSLALIFFYSFTRPLQLIVKKLLAVDFNFPSKKFIVNPTKNKDDELSLLVKSLNKLLEGFGDSLEQRRTIEIELQKYQKQLEELVKERTMQLELTNELLENELAEKKKTELALAEEKEKLAETNKELEEFTYIASHDLQEPLRKISAFGDILKTKYEKSLDASGLDYLERMINSSLRMKNLISSLLMYSRIGTKAITFEKVDINNIVAEVLLDFEIPIKQTNAKIEVSNLPVINANPLQMHQLFQNLIGNALKYSKKDICPEIKISSSSHIDNSIIITIQDNGIGFDEQYAEKIFGVFQRLHGKNEYEGTGIGLSICRKIMEKHNGHIIAYSKAGEGSTFTIFLLKTF